jgi:hypothetical protein
VEPTLLIPLIPRGVELGMVLTAALAVVLLVFAGGYWYLIKRNHQADDPTLPDDEDATDDPLRRR